MDQRRLEALAIHVSARAQRALRAHHRSLATGVVALLTGFGKSLKIPAAHADAPVLAKPVEPGALVACLRRLTTSDA